MPRVTALSVSANNLQTSFSVHSPLSTKNENLHSFKEGLILLCQSILETRRISHLHGSALFTIPLNVHNCTLLHAHVLSLRPVDQVRRQMARKGFL